jgi:alanyl-tRNA synthetase
MQLDILARYNIGAFKIIQGVEEISPESAKTLVFELGKLYPEAVIVLGSLEDDKPLVSVYAGTTVQTTQKIDARHLVKLAGAHIQGGGGGQPFYATAGGKKKEGLEAAVSAAAESVKLALA